MAPPKSKPVENHNQSKKRKGSENAPTNAKRSRKAKKSRVRRSNIESSEDEELGDLSTSSDDDVVVSNDRPRRSSRAKGKSRANYRVDSYSDDDGDGDDDSSNIPSNMEQDKPESDTEQQNPVAVKIEEPDRALGGSTDTNENATRADTGPPSATDLVDDEEEKVKPVLNLQYKGFSIYGRCLCVVVEPYPPMRGSTRAPSMAPQRLPPRMSSIAPPDYEANFDDRASVPPLFLPDYDRERSVTPAQPLTRRMTSPLLSFEEQDEEDEEGFGMMAFSQVLNSVSGEGKGGIDEDDEIDGGVFFGDADESRDIG